MTSPRKSPRFREILRDPRLALMLALGFSSGLPFLLIFSTQSAWLREAGVSRSVIGLMSYAALAFTFKFAWAPIIDEYDPPLVGAWLGRRRGWLLTAQLGVAAGLSGLAFGAPAESLGWSFAFAFLTAFAAASQDVTIDGWRIDAAPTERQGMMSASYQLGYRLALLCAGPVRSTSPISGVGAPPILRWRGSCSSESSPASCPRRSTGRGKRRAVAPLLSPAHLSSRSAIFSAATAPR
jgi:PAT family beta-lactamase induction signal transducer AmpG